MKRTLRERAIVRLAEDLKEILFQDDGYCEDILRAGFKGFDNFTDEELEHEHLCRFDQTIEDYRP